MALQDIFTTQDKHHNYVLLIIIQAVYDCGIEKHRFFFSASDVTEEPLNS